jgi:hypothetical protein
MNFIKLLTLSFLLVLGLTVSAQEDDKPAPYKRPDQTYKPDTTDGFRSFAPKKKIDYDKFLLGPMFQAFFTNNYYQFGIMPSLGYKVWKELYVGGTINYSIEYVPHYDGTSASPSATLQVYGGGPFVHYNVWKRFFVRSRLELLSVRYPNLNYGYNKVSYASRGIPYLWLGAGYNLTTSKNLFIPLALYVNPLYGSYDGIEKGYSPYSAICFQVAFYILSVH